MVLTARSDVSRPSSETAGRDGWEYRPYLDGLRAVAVYLVIAFHAGSHRFNGGFIGVDVFFVLSGYLVTQLLTRDLHAGGRIRLRRFYARRYRRLLPAAFAALLVTSAVYAAIGTPLEVHDAVGGVRAAFLYVANWFFIGQSNNYFAANIANSPVVHFWSLAVEEQFYALWPLLLTGMYLVTRSARERQWQFIRVFVAIGGVASLFAAWHISHANLSRAYYGTDTRAYQLLAGAFVALSPRLLGLGTRKRRIAQRCSPVLLFVIVLMATSVVHVGAIQRGAIIALTTCLFIVALENSDGGVAKRALSGSRVTYLGRVSYGTYLWHWPVLLVATRTFHMSSSARIGIACLVASALAAFSYEMLERPIRQARALDRLNTLVIVTGLVVTVFAGFVLVPAILRFRHGSASAVLSPNAANTSAGLVPSNIDWESARSDRAHVRTCLGLPVDECVVVRGKRGGLVLVGDSHARMLIPAFTEIAKRASLTFSTAIMPDCPWQIGLQYDVEGGVVDQCRRRKTDWYARVIPNLAPGVVVLVNRSIDDASAPIPIIGPSGRVLTHNSKDYEPVIAMATSRTVKQLRDEGADVVMIEPVTVAPFDTLNCLSGAKTLEACRFVASTNPSPLERYYRAIADGRHVWSIDIDRLICPYLPICDPLENGVVVRRDNSHITAQYAEAISGRLQTLLEQQGILGG
jgi:peptidoglycan/LPS O-acetylase OafA/YrhL